MRATYSASNTPHVLAPGLEVVSPAHGLAGETVMGGKLDQLELVPEIWTEG